MFSNQSKLKRPSPTTFDETGPPWGTDVNEPGGRLFGEAILKPGERRKLFDWEVPFYLTSVLSVVIVGVGLSSRPESKLHLEVQKEAEKRVTALLANDVSTEDDTEDDS